MTLRTLFFLACVLLEVHGNTFMGSDYDDYDIAPRELFHTLRPDDIVEEVVIQHTERKPRSRNDLNGQVDNIKPREERQLISEILDQAIREAENSRSVDDLNHRERSSKSRITRERLLSLLGDARNFDSAFPSTSTTTRNGPDGLAARLVNFTRRIKVNTNLLPGTVQPDGTRCIEKVDLVEETVFERGMNCQHKLNKKCHLTYVTDYHSAPERKCDTTFAKSCYISFKPVPHTEKVKRCHTPHEKKCGDEVVGPTVCKDHYETVCDTKYKEYEVEQDEPNCRTVEELRCVNATVELLNLPHRKSDKDFAVKEKCEKWPVQKCDLQRKNIKKVHPETECKKVAKEVCAPSNCEVIPGNEICNEEVINKIQNIPEEECDLQPQENCRTESTLVPRLVPKKNCVKVPKETCYNTKSNPKKVKKPRLRTWCYSPRDLRDAVNQDRE